MLTFAPSPDRFVVEEIPAYTPSGEGTHTFLWIEKRGLSTFDAIARLAAAFHVLARDVGHAGMKDRHALTRQWLSLPGTVAPDVATAFVTAELSVLAAAQHPHKLRIGHLRGNRFEVVLTGPASDAEVAGLRTRFAAAAAAGVPNRYGEQRFGAARDNAAVGLALLRGERRERDRRKRGLMLSALQSAVFNRALELRGAKGHLDQVQPGDVLQKTVTGGLFVSTDPTVDQARVASGELCITGPLPGGREIEPPPDTPARALEDQAIADVGATREDFSRAGRDLPGARRPLLLKVTAGDDAVTEDPGSSAEARAIRLRFALPAGGYATVVVAALTSEAG
jgi:tRNA pseudouridine13 synthase